ncbi:MAG TPA: hypothetical protein PK014_13665 [Thermoanaerobaculia bacterium]|nr:hypothetical protein [Thermoanaerobaculia bacterium]HUM28521.1 hypothetical protein [Thermoanaerobaculia bacterium]HXK66871.1 hypothetical protein [Thermoanaerobaculia bacterium]
MKWRPPVPSPSFWNRATKEGRWVTWLAIAALTFLLGRAFQMSYYPRYDSGGFLVAGKALAEGKGLTEISHPEAPSFILYPPAYPAILAPQILLFDLNYNLLRIHLILFFLGLLILVYRVFPAPESHWIILFLCLSNLARYILRIQGEIPLALVIMAAVVLYVKGRERWMILPLLLAPLLKPIGLMLPLAYGLDGLYRFLRRRATIVPVLIALLASLPFVGWTLWAQPGLLQPSRTPLLADTWTGETQELLQPTDLRLIQRAGSNFARILNETLPQSLVFSDSYHDPASVPPPLWPIGLLLLIGGLAAARQSSFLAFLLPIHLALLCIIPVVSPRYFVLVLPFYLAGICRIIGAGRRIHRMVPVGIVLVSAGILLYLVGSTAENRDLWTMNSVNGIVAREAGLRLPEDAVVLVNDPYGFYLVTGRTAISYLRSEQKSPPKYFLGRYAARHGRLTHGAIYSYEWSRFTSTLEKLHLRASGREEHDQVITMGLAYEDR